MTLLPLPNKVNGYGSVAAKLMTVGEAPGFYENESGIPLSGPTGKLHGSILQEFGVHISETYRTNVRKYRPPDNNLKRYVEYGIDIEKEIEELWQEIEAINPNVIQCLGNLSLQVLTGRDKITRQRGSILTTQRTVNGRFIKVVPTIHPANFLERSDRGGKGAFKYSAIKYVELDYKRAIEESSSPELRLPERFHQICSSSLDLFRFLRQYEDKDEVTLDLETPHAIPLCIALAFNEHHSLSIPLLNVKGDKDKYWIPDHDLVVIWQMLARFLEDPKLKIVGQNIKFDHDKIRKVMRMNIPRPYFDTMLAQHILYPEFPKRLEFLTSVYTREPYYKDEGKEFNLGKDDLSRLLIYNGKDSCVTKEIKDKQYVELQENGLLHFMVDSLPSDPYNLYYMRLHEMYMEMEQTGIRLDENKRLPLYKKYKKLHDECQVKLVELVGHKVNVNSSKQVLECLKELGFPPRKDTEEDTLVALYANHAKTDRQKQGLDSILKDRKYRKTNGTYVCSLPDFDGRARTSVRIVGSETGRASDSKVKMPLRPYIYTKGKKLGIGYAFKTLTKHGDIGPEIRELMVVDPGTCFIEFDAKAAEARIAALLATDEETLELFDKADPHKDLAAKLFEIRLQDVTKEMRFVAKTSRYLGQYRGGKHRLMLSINTDAKKFKINIQISEWKAGKLLDRYHQENPKIRSIFHESIIQQIHTNRTLVAPSGIPRTFWERFGDELYGEALAHIPQRTVHDHVTLAILRIKERLPYFQLQIESHDAGFGQIPVEKRDESIGVIQEEMERLIDFSKCSLPRRPLKIPCEIKIGKENYRDLEDVA